MTRPIAPTVAGLFNNEFPVRLTAYDGSSAGVDSEYGMELTSERALRYLVTAPGDLGLARAYVSGDLVMHGVHPGDPYPLLSRIVGRTDFERPSVPALAQLVRDLGLQSFVPPTPPAEEHLPGWRHRLEGLRTWSRHSEARDADAIHHHYDVSNEFYEYVLGPSMAYTCAVFEREGMTLEEAQEAKFDLICRKLDLQPGQRLLDIGCGWGGMVRHAAKHYGVRALGVTLSAEQAEWAQCAIKEDGLDDLAEVRFLDYRHVEETDFDAVSSIGLTEHIGIENYPAYFEFVRSKVRPQGRMLNHCITRNGNRPTRTGKFIDRYVFPDGELAGSGTIVTAIEDAGLEVQHQENFRLHYASTLAEWNRNLVANWDACVREVGLGTAKVWGLYIAGSRIGFERDEVQLHHVLATRSDEGISGYPLRHNF